MNTARKDVAMVYGPIRVQADIAGSPIACIRINSDFSKASIALEFAAALMVEVATLHAELDQWLE